jgi:nitrate reductase NapAB chaperone NapD
MRTHRRHALRPNFDRLDDRCLLSGLTPAELTHAYGLDAITFPTSSGPVSGSGSGETIALVEAYNDPTLSSDLATFDQEYNLPAASLTVIDQAGAVTNNGWALEEALDVEWTHAIAPGANIVVVEARSQSRQDLLTAVNTARYTPGVVAVSMSWGFSETRNESSYNTFFQTPAGHVGITFIAASGDNGIAGGVEWPSSSPDVLAVGGTSLFVDSSGDYQSEVAWSGSGGGYSRFGAEPSYQRSVQGTGDRSAPDVAFDADPNTGVQVYETPPGAGHGYWQVVGGTSLGTPAWSAIIAIVDQGRALVGKGSLDGPSQTLPTLYAVSSTDFHTIAPRARDATGANTSTGRGTPNGPALVDDLVASNIATPLTTGRGMSRQAHATRIKERAKKAVVVPHRVSLFSTRLRVDRADSTPNSRPNHFR